MADLRLDLPALFQAADRAASVAQRKHLWQVAADLWTGDGGAQRAQQLHLGLA